MAPDSLYRWCQRSLLLAERHLATSLDHVRLPVSVHVELFVEAVLGVCRSELKTGASIKHLVSAWPCQTLVLSTLLPENKLSCLLSASDGQLTVLDWIIEGLLNLKPRAKLTQINFSCVTAASIFHLPVLFQTKSEILSNEVKNSIIAKGRIFVDEEEEEMMESMLSWKLTEISERKTQMNCRYHGPGTVEILLETRLSLTEWMALVDQLIGISTQDLSPYRYKFTHLSVDNFNMMDSQLLKWFLSTVDPQALTKLYIYGKTKCMSLVMWELNEQLSKMSHLQEFGLGTAGPKEHFQTANYNENKYNKETGTVLENWKHLQELNMVGIMLTTKVDVWLSSLQNPLQKLSLYSCKLVKENLQSLAASHHLPHLLELGLENNDLRGTGHDLTILLKHATRLETLNLVGTNLLPSEKFSVMSALEGLERLHTLVLYEQDDMLTGNCYQSIVERACRIQSLKEFYLFPFNYRPFEVFHRKAVEEVTQMVLQMNGRTDIQLSY